MTKNLEFLYTLAYKTYATFNVDINADTGVVTLIGRNPNRLEHSDYPEYVRVELVEKA